MQEARLLSCGAAWFSRVREDWRGKAREPIHDSIHSLVYVTPQITPTVVPRVTGAIRSKAFRLGCCLHWPQLIDSVQLEPADEFPRTPHLAANLSCRDCARKTARRGRCRWATEAEREKLVNEVGAHLALSRRNVRSLRQGAYREATGPPLCLDSQLTHHSQLGQR